jgi:hypothetical protein
MLCRSPSTLPQMRLQAVCNLLPSLELLDLRFPLLLLLLLEFELTRQTTTGFQLTVLDRLSDPSTGCQQPIDRPQSQKTNLLPLDIAHGSPPLGLLLPLGRLLLLFGVAVLFLLLGGVRTGEFVRDFLARLSELAGGLAQRR